MTQLDTEKHMELLIDSADLARIEELKRRISRAYRDIPDASTADLFWAVVEVVNLMRADAANKRVQIDIPHLLHTALLGPEMFEEMKHDNARH